MNLPGIVERISSRETSAPALLEQCLDAARDPTGEGARVFTLLRAEKSRQEAQRSEERLNAGAPARRLEALPISVKDLFDVESVVTCAGSVTLAGNEAAVAHADAVQRLSEAGALIIGKTNMTEFAYSGMGVNPHFGTPLNPFDRGAERLPGGSSCGAAVSVSDGMAAAALGTDTGGSVRIPAALCGLVGWKPTASRVSLAGTLPLSPSLDSVGPIASDVASCRLIDSVLTKTTYGTSRGTPIGTPASPPAQYRLAGRRFAVPAALLSQDTDTRVGPAIERALSTLSRQGAAIEVLELPEITGVITSGAGPVIVASEAYAWHRANLEGRGHLYDPRVRSRLERGAQFSAWEYLDALACRAASISAVDRRLREFDAWLMPTVPIIAPRLSDCRLDEDFFRINTLLLRNPSIVNFLDGCAVSVPCHSMGEAPVGLTIAGLRGSDERILALASAVEHALLESRT